MNPALLFNRTELEGLSVLDLGAGSRARFAKELAESGVNARVISLSPDFSTRLYSRPAREGHPQGKLLAALGEKLPFPDNSFDRVFA